ncbi:unnamed protein product [Rotaria sordida]|uniref:Uncharacterized protein n=1 Tax=Rotaria sordida TaxID=392033 RepID=A0A818UDP0_9BILA|nr:unnamed protein product [Rotaria sordida]
MKEIFHLLQILSSSYDNHLRLLNLILLSNENELSTRVNQFDEKPINKPSDDNKLGKNIIDHLSKKSINEINF